MKERREEFQRLREELSDFEYEIPADGWREMSAILDGDKPVPQPDAPQQRRRRFAGWLWLIGALFLSGSLWLGAQQGWVNTSQGQTTSLSALPIPMLAAVPATSAEEAKAAGLPSTKAPRKQRAKQATPPPPALEGREAPPKGAASASKGLPLRLPDTLVQALQPKAQSPAETPIAGLPATENRTGHLVWADGLDVLPRRPATLSAEDTAASALPDIVPAKRPRLGLGLKAGADHQALQTNALIGAFAQFRLHPKWALEVGPQYKRRSAGNGRGLGITPPQLDTIYTPALAGISPFYKPITRLHFFEAPITLHYQASKRLQVLGGVQLAYLHSSTEPLPGESYSQEDSASEFFLDASRSSNLSAAPAEPSVREWDLGLAAGINYRLAPRWSVELRYLQGLGDLTPNDYYGNEEAYFNSSFQFAMKWHWK